MSVVFSTIRNTRMVCFILMGLLLCASLTHSQQKPKNLWKPTPRKSLVLPARRLPAPASQNDKAVPPRFKEGELLVGFKPGLKPEERGNAHKNIGATLKKRFKSINVDLVKLPKGVGVKNAEDRYKKNKNIRFAEPNYEMNISDFRPATAPRANPTTKRSTTIAQYFPNDPMFDQQWALHNTGQTGGTADADIDGPEAWTVEKGNSSIIVAVIDSGVDYTHEDLKNQMWVNTAEKNGAAGVDDDNNGYIDDIYGYDFRNKDGDPFDDNSHGTHVAGIIAAEQDNGVGVSGIAPGVKIMALKYAGSGGYGWTSDTVSCFEYATAMGADLTNNSWGGSGYSQALKDAIELFAKPTICAAGNDHSNTDTEPHYPSGYNSSNIISVLSSDHNDTKSGFSNYGITSVDIGAPGSSILSSVPGDQYASYSGTSMATPYVAGAVALVLSKYPSLTTNKVLSRLYINGDNVSALVGKTNTGKRVNASAVLGTVSNYPPEAINLSISGNLWVESTVSAQYQYTDEEGDPEGNSIITWHIAEDTNGKNSKKVQEGTSSNYTFTRLDGGKYVRIQVDPVATSGLSPGFPSFSNWIGPISSIYPVFEYAGRTALSEDYIYVAANVYLLGGSTIIDRGFVYSTAPNPTLSDNAESAGGGTGEYKLPLTNLAAGTKYYIRAYAENSAGVSYSDVFEVITLSSGSNAHKLLPVTDIDIINFGDDVTLNNRLAAVMASNEGKSKVYIYYLQDSGMWALEHVVHNLFYPSVTASEDSILISNYATSKVDIYKRTGSTNSWEKTGSINSPESPASRFGDSVNYFNGKLAVGATSSNGANTSSGAVFIYEYDAGSSTWIQKDKIYASDGLAGDYFGSSVAINTNSILISAINKNEIGTRSGAAYLFELDGGQWNQIDKYFDPNGINYQYFGRGLSISSNIAAIGNYHTGAKDEYTGIVYVYEKNSVTNQWEFVSRLTAPNELFTNNYFGYSVSANDNMLVIGSHNSNGNYSRTGAVFIYKKDSTTNSWYPYKKLNSPDEQVRSKFGSPVVLSGNKIIAGEGFLYDSGVPIAGAAYIIDTGGLNPNHPPIAYDVNISGALTVSNDLTGQYSYYNKEGEAEGASTYQWYLADDADGKNKTEAPARGKNYKPRSSDLGKFISFEVTPIASAGEINGMPSATAFLGPISSGSTHLVSVSGAGTGSGSITSSPGTINAQYNGSSTTGTKSYSFEKGSSVTLTATPETGTTFSGWSGAVSGSNSSITITVNADKSVTATFTKDTGSLKVTISPAEAVTAGAKWRRTGTTTWQDSGATESNVPVGNHTVEFKAVTDWAAPSNQAVTISKNTLTEATGTYTQDFGSLTVTISPTGAVDAGAQWRRVGTTTWLDSGTTESDVPVGDHDVEFRTVDAWSPPPQQSVTISKDQETILNVAYEEGCIKNYDVNLDGSVTPGDALMVFKHYLGTESITDSCSLTRADANGDGSITPGDALIIFKEYLGLN